MKEKEKTEEKTEEKKKHPAEGGWAT